METEIEDYGYPKEQKVKIQLGNFNIASIIFQGSLAAYNFFSSWRTPSPLIVFCSTSWIDPFVTTPQDPINSPSSHFMKKAAMFHNEFSQIKLRHINTQWKLERKGLGSSFSRGPFPALSPMSFPRMPLPPPVQLKASGKVSRSHINTSKCYKSCRCSGLPAMVPLVCPSEIQW